MGGEGKEGLGKIVYGEYDRDGAFIIFKETAASGLAEEIAAIEACRTVGEARRLNDSVVYTYVPGGVDDFPDEDGEPLPDDAPYNSDDIGEVQDGEWPPMAGAHALDALPPDLVGLLIDKADGRLVHTMSGSALNIPLTREEDLVSVIRSAGYSVYRDDGLVNSLNSL